MMPCTIRQLEVFVAAAKAGHFGRTAGALGISQPAVTKQIAALERHVGMILFVRRRGSLPVLSRDGEAFLDQAKRLLAEAQSLNAHCIGAAGEPSTVRIAGGAYIMSELIRPWLPEFARANDGVMVTCIPVASSSDGLEMLEAGAADVLLYTMSRLEIPGFEIEPVRSVRLSLYGGRGYQTRRRSSPEEISELPFLLPPAGSEIERIVLDALAAAGVFCSQIVMRQQYSDVIRQLAIDGKGVAPLFDPAAAVHVERGELVRFDLELPTLHRAICRRERAATSPMIDIVTDSLREAMKR